MVASVVFVLRQHLGDDSCCQKFHDVALPLMMVSVYWLCDEGTQNSQDDEEADHFLSGHHFENLHNIEEFVKMVEIETAAHLEMRLTARYRLCFEVIILQPYI
ncbi:hypothetical protein AVEN_59688-1 [Araneus ventricosus]|uniref:Uncharacterized protein n=1 Tax=Araneus ventricosus TaxID=182803 RepID=A0A4Y2BPG5_ARAVE|nr:hypothetical protein AVEN_59688-1 [Araneus ventricosus]